MTFSKSTLASLVAAGWHENRSIDIQIYKAAFEKEKMELPSVVQEFLRQFGGLFIDSDNGWSGIDLFAEDAVQGMGSLLQSYKKVIGCRVLSPIGYCYSSLCLLMMTEIGKVYGGLNWTLFFLGNTGVEAIDNITVGREPLDIIHINQNLPSTKQEPQREGAKRLLACGRILSRLNRNL